MQRLYIILLVCGLLCIGCQWHLRPSETPAEQAKVSIERYDRMEHLYLTTADFAALQQMKTQYPAETRMLIEDVLRLGQVDEPDINTRFLLFFQDSTLQVLLGDVEQQFADLSTEERQLTKAFSRLQHMLPEISAPHVYTQIGALDQSIVVGDGLLGISLDKYLGTDHPLYLRYDYSERQRQMMSRQYIVPDCLGFYLLSLYPPAEDHVQGHMAKIQYVVNRALGRKLFQRDSVAQVERYMLSHHGVSIGQLLTSDEPF